MTRKTVSTRLSAVTRQKIEDAARAAGRSLTQEIEFRLERSFLMDDVVGYLKSREHPLAGKSLTAASPLDSLGPRHWRKFGTL